MTTHSRLHRVGDHLDTITQWAITIAGIAAGAALVSGVATLVMLAVIDATSRWAP